VAELENRDDRPELFLANQPAVLVDVGDDRRLNEVAAALRPLAAGKNARTAFLRVLQDADHALILLAVLNRTKLGVRLEAAANLGLARLLRQRLAQRVVDSLVRVDALDRH